MRFYSDGPSIPDILLERCDAGRVVFLCGAGVSSPSGMPTFIGLTQYVIDFFMPPEDSEIMTAFRPWVANESGANVPLDQIFNLLHLEYGKDEVNALVTKRLSLSPGNETVGREHALIRRISSSARGAPQIVTTNFDRLFETGKDGSKLVHYVPPAFPDLNFGSSIEGVTYLHGRLVDEVSKNHPYVLSSADFGRAYLSEGWATNFVRHLLERHTVVLVGYKAEDPPIKYLLQGLNHDGKYDRSKLYAFERGLPEQIEARWRDRGVTAIAYAEHRAFWKTMEAWADRADDTRKWRSSAIAKCQQDPKDLEPHERGQVAHVLRTVQGAKLFSVAEPIPHPEWVCVLDADVRSAKQSHSYSDDAEVFDPRTAYGLDDDVEDLSDDIREQGISNDNLLRWRDGDESPHDFHRLGGPAGTLPKRLLHFTTWIGKSITSPVLAWWVIRQNGIHPQLVQWLEWQLQQSKDLDKRARHIWGLILEHHRVPRSRLWNVEWFDVKRQIEVDGWTPTVLRQFRRATVPRLEIQRPYGVRQSRPPQVSWHKVHFGDLGQFKLVFLDRHNENVDIPDNVLPQVFAVLEEQLLIAAGMLEDIDAVYFKTPSCYRGREADEEEPVSKSVDIVVWFVRLFDRIVAQFPKLANAHATTWFVTEPFIFRKLKLYAFSKANVFAADYVVSEILSFSQETFWDTNVARELLFLMVDRWTELSQVSQDRLIDRILEGPDRRPHWTDEQSPRFRVQLTCRYARYLEMQGCKLSPDRCRRLVELIQEIPEWNDGWATSTVTERGIHAGWVGTDEAPDVLVDLPISEVIPRAIEDLKRDFDSLTERRPFVGLVKSSPRKALSALTYAAKRGDFETTFWSSLISDLPANVSPRLRSVFLNRIARLPHNVIADLRHTLGLWLQQNFAAVVEFDSVLGWTVFDHIVDGLLAAGTEAARSGLDEVYRAGKVVQRSKRTYEHAINGPIGMCVEVLFRAVPGEQPVADSLIPAYIKTRVERLLVAPGEGADHAVSIASHKLNWLMFVDPAWTTERFIPLLDLEHPAAEPAWNGFLCSGRAPSPRLATIIRPLLLRLFPWIEQFSWDRDLPNVAGQWLGVLRIFHRNEPIGLSQAEMRSVLRAMSDDVRNQFIFWLGLVGQKYENGWERHVVPLINEDWPREAKYRTTASMRAWISLLDDTGESFPLIYEKVKRFLVPMETADHPFYRFTREIDDEKSIAELYPETTLDLINKVTPQVLSCSPYELPKILALIAQSKPELVSDPRYLRLIDLVDRS